MGMVHLFFIPKHIDKKIIECFVKLNRLFEPNDLQLNITAYPNILIENNLGSEFGSDTNDLLSRDSYLVKFFHLYKRNVLSIDVHRGGYGDQKSPYFDEVRIDDSSFNGINRTLAFTVIDLLVDQLTPVDPNKNISLGLSREQAEAGAVHLEVLNRLEQLGEKMLSDTFEIPRKLEEEYQEKLARKYEEYSQYKQEMENEYSHLKSDLDDKQKVLDETLKTLDDRNNTHVRRQIRKDILEVVKNRTESFTLTKDTNILRRPIYTAMWTLILVFGFLVIITSLNIFDNTNKEFNDVAIGIVKLSLSTIGLVSSILYFIKWQSRWLEQHARAEFQLKQFQLDIERASWVVETTLEWNDAKGTTIPDTLLESLTRNIFVDSNKEIEPALHPADQLASALLGTSSKVRLKAGESEIDIDPRKIKA